MKTITMIKLRFLILVALGSMAAASCTKYSTPPFVEEDVAQTEGRLSINKYILWINLEGAGGGELVKNALPDGGVIKGLLPHSRYSWEGLEAEHRDDSFVPTEENAVACASMLTGNMPIRHGIADDTYTSEQVFDPDFDEAMKDYPGFFQYMSDYDKALKTLAITPWKMQNEKLLNKAGTTLTSASDEETLDLALQRLAEENNSITYLSFRSVLDAGKQGGWKPENANYANTMRTMDNYAGQLLDAVRARPNAYFEDWLVIITSNHGGTADGRYGGSSREERNMFGIFYFDHFSQPMDMNPGMLEALRYDWSFQGTVIDSLTYVPGSNDTEVAVWRQIYSPDSLAGGMTVEYIMATRPSVNRSYIPGGQSGVTLFEKSKWNIGLSHTYCATWGSFLSTTDGEITNAGYFVNPMIHTFSATMNFHDVSAYSQKETVAASTDKWGNVTPAYDRYIPRRSGSLDVHAYYNGLHIGTGKPNQAKDQPSSWYVDDNNLVIRDGMRWSYRYLLEIRIWNRALSESEIRQYSQQLQLTPATCSIYNHLTGYWQFYKGAEGQYLKDDSLVVNQIPTVKKRIRTADGQEVEQTLSTEPIRLRKKNEDGVYVPVTGEDIRYTLLPNTLSQTIAQKGRMMESSMVLPAILEWMGAPYPVEATRASGGYTTSKLDGVCKPYDPATKTFLWTGPFLGDYTMDLEWRDYEK